MGRISYAVVDAGGHLIANGMDLDIAVTLLVALMEKRSEEKELLLSIQRVYDEPCKIVDADEGRPRAASVVDEFEVYGEDC